MEGLRKQYSAFCRPAKIGRNGAALRRNGTCQNAGNFDQRARRHEKSGAPAAEVAGRYFEARIYRARHTTNASYLNSFILTGLPDRLPPGGDLTVSVR